MDSRKGIYLENQNIEKEKMQKAAREYEVALAALEVKKGTKDKITRLCEKVIYGKGVENKRKALADVRKVLNARATELSVLSKKDIEKLVKGKYEYLEKSKLVDSVYFNPKKTLIDILNDYLDAFKRYEQLEKSIAELSNAKKEVYPEKTEDSKVTSTTYVQSSNSGLGLNVNGRPSTGVNSPLDEATIVGAFNNAVNNAVKTPYYTGYILDHNAKTYIRNNCGPLYDVEGYIEYGATAEMISRKFDSGSTFKKSTINYRIDELVMFAGMVYNKLPELLTNHSGYLSNAKFNDLSNKFNVGRNLENGLDVYEKAYNMFLKYYLKASTDEKNKIDQYAKVKFSELAFAKNLNLTGVLEPSKLKFSVNNKIRKIMLEKRHEYAKSDRNTNVEKKIELATKYMMVNEIASLYHDFCKAETQYSVYGRNEEEQRRAEESRRNRLKGFQESFARVIFARLNKEKHPTEQDLNYICNKYFSENYGLNDVYIASKDDKSRFATDDLFREAEARFYNLSKIQQTMARISGTWKKYERYRQIIANNEGYELTEEQFVEIDSMFKGGRK